MINAELDTSTIEIANSIDNVAIDNTNITAGYDNSYNVDTEDLSDLDITVAKKEYTIVGDGIFIPSMYDDAPPWLKELIDTTIDVAVGNRDQSLIDRLRAILTAMDYVPKNQYTEQINQIISEEGIINSRIATLNSNLVGAINTTNATIAEINLTYASKNEAAAIASNVITASLSGSGEIGSALIQLQEAYANLESTTAQSVSMLESVMEGEINGNATAMEQIRTEVTSINGEISSQAEQITTLQANVSAVDGKISTAKSEVVNTVNTTIANGDAIVESKFAYNSVVNINGVYKRSGFGLSTNYTSGNGTQANPYTSEFWIDATKLRFTNSANTGRTAPFTIDASGTTPQITFNGVVKFSNVTGTTALYDSINTAQTTANTANNNAIARTLPSEVAAAVNNNVTTINGSKITTGSITAAQIQANSISADRLTSTNGHSTVWTGGGLISNNFNGNPVDNIGNPTQGFRLSSNAAGTKTDPNIYGAYIKGGILEGSNLWLSTPAGYAKVQHLDMLYYNFGLSPGPFTYTLYSSYIELVSPTYGSGYLPNRVFSLGSSIISIITTGAINSTAVGVNLSLQYSADDGAWTKLDKFSGNLPGVNVIYYGLCPDFSSTLRIRLSITYINSIGFAYSSTASAALTLINQN